MKNRFFKGSTKKQKTIQTPDNSSCFVILSRILPVSAACYAAYPEPAKGLQVPAHIEAETDAKDPDGQDRKRVQHRRGAGIQERNHHPLHPQHTVPAPRSVCSSQPGRRDPSRCGPLFLQAMGLQNDRMAVLQAPSQAQGTPRRAWLTREGFGSG